MRPLKSCQPYTLRTTAFAGQCYLPPDADLRSCARRKIWGGAQILYSPLNDDENDPVTQVYRRHYW